jgi:hypothetical protein
MLRLIRIFDGKAISRQCQGLNCKKNATRASVYKDNPNPMWWCNECDPYLHGALLGNLQIIETYSDALNYVGNYCKGRKSDYKFLILALAQAKGLGRRVGETEVQKWFNRIFIFR